jgi:hypothetical protein
MTRPLTVLLSLIAAIGVGAICPALAQEGTPGQTHTATNPEGVVAATVITIQGKVVKVDRSKKQVTLEGSQGRSVTLNVANPYNLNAAKVGTPFIARYYEVVSIRKKKPGETVPSASLKGGVATAEAGAVPGAVGEQHIGLLVSVTAIDEAKGTITVQARDGTVETVKPRNPRNLKHLKVGDELVIGISRAIAISFDKESMSKPS